MIEDLDIDRDSWTTPRSLTKKLGQFDLDPCSNSRSTVIATRTFDLERGQDGLRMSIYVSKSTRTFINCPYSRGQVIRWVMAYRHTRFCFLLRFDPSTEWFGRLWQNSELVCVLKDRIEFEPPPGAPPPTSNPYPHAFFWRFAEDVTRELLDACYVMQPRR